MKNKTVIIENDALQNYLFLAAKRAGGQTQLAANLGISLSYLNGVMTDARLAGKKLLAAIGWRERRIFEPDPRARLHPQNY